MRIGVEQYWPSPGSAGTSQGARHSTQVMAFLDALLLLVHRSKHCLCTLLPHSLQKTSGSWLLPAAACALKAEVVRQSARKQNAPQPTDTIRTPGIWVVMCLQA